MLRARLGRPAVRHVSLPFASTWHSLALAPRCTLPRPCAVHLHTRLLSDETSSQTAFRRDRVRIYTRTGDKGTSSLYNGERRSKDNPTFHALGATDMANAQIGVAREYCESAFADMEGDAQATAIALSTRLQQVQSQLLDLGSHIATPMTSSKSAEEALSRTAFAGSHSKELEHWIDDMDDSLPPLRNFILPGGGMCSAHLHVARAACREAERAMVSCHADGDVSDDALRFINRLSDFLFSAARLATELQGATETVYRKAS